VGIATIIAASSLAVIAIAIAYVVIRIGRLIDEAKASLKVLTDETAPLIDEVHTTVTLVKWSAAQHQSRQQEYRRDEREGQRGNTRFHE
jgi:hypothetical protein